MSLANLETIKGYSIEGIGAQYDSTTQSLPRRLLHKPMEVLRLLPLEVACFGAYHPLAVQATVLMQHQRHHHCQVQDSSGGEGQLHVVVQWIPSDQAF